MPDSSPKKIKLLPANAYSKLGPGETYKPIVGPADTRPEISVWSVTTGLAMVVFWSIACVYMAVRTGNAIEAAIPIAVMAVFFGKLRKSRSSILENVIVQSIGQASGVVAAGAAFVIPALYINEIRPAWWQIALATAIGGFLGTVLIIPLRKYFVRDQHGEYPFPEGTAINEIVVSGESAGKGAGKIMMISLAVGAVFDLMTQVFHLWNTSLSSSTLLRGWGAKLADVRMEVKMEGVAALFGLGLIIGLRYAAIIAAGSVLAYVVLVPLVFLVGSQVPALTYAGVEYHIATMSAGQVFAAFIKPIGIGAIAVSGFIGLLRMSKIVVSSVSLGFKGMAKKQSATVDERTQRDMAPANVLLIQGITTIAMGVLFFVVASGHYAPGKALFFSVVGMVVGFVLSFLFTPVAAQAIAIVGVNPVSGMTLITIVIAAASMGAVGLAGKPGMFVALVIGTAVCTALSTSGALITDFKIGYWIGSTPRSQQVWKFLGIAVAALTVAFVIPLMDHAYHFLVEVNGLKVSNENVLPAPQANMLATIVKGLMSDAQQPFLLYAFGGLIAVMLYMMGVPILAFSLGMYLSISLNMAVLAGGFTAWLIGKTGKTEEVKKARAGQGSLIAAGMMAGAAFAGIIAALTRLPEIGAPIRYLAVGATFVMEKTAAGVAFLNPEPVLAGWFAGFPGQMLGLVMFVGLGLVVFLLARLGAVWELRESNDAEQTAASETEKVA